MFKKRRNSWACIGNPNRSICCQTTASLCNKESEPRAGNHQRHTRTRNVSLPTQANHTVRGARKPPIGALHMQLAKIPQTGCVWNLSDTGHTFCLQSHFLCNMAVREKIRTAVSVDHRCSHASMLFWAPAVALAPALLFRVHHANCHSHGGW